MIDLTFGCYQDIQQAAEEEHHEYPGVEAHGQISAAPLMTSAAPLMSAARLRPTRGPGPIYRRGWRGRVTVMRQGHKVECNCGFYFTANSHQ